MKILVTNDDGISAEGLWTLVKGLKNIAQVVVVAPDREQSGIGTAITLSQPLKIKKVRPIVPEVEAYSVKGTPGDCVILALEKLVKNEISLVVSGINQGPNLGHDVFVSGTVGAALQGYLRAIPSFAISVFHTDNKNYLNKVAEVAALLAEKICSNTLPANVFLNVNLPDLPLVKIKGLKVTRLVNETHLDTVEEGYDGRQKCYWLVRLEINKGSDKTTDVGAIEQGNISITPLHTYLDNKSSPVITDSFCSDALEKLQKN